MKKNLSRLGTMVLMLVFVLVLVQIVGVMAAVTPGGIGGWGWSSTIGWLSASSTDTGAGGGPYQVVADVSGNMTGYMWSPNIGWVKFGGLASFPGAGSNAAVNLTNGAVTGWVRACAGTLPGDCSVMTSRSDGWDGWIELSGANHATSDMTGNGGVTMDSTTGAFTGYAWGGSVVGWIQFNTAATTGVKLCPSGGCSVITITGNCTAAPNPPTNLPPNASVTFTANPTSGTGPYTYNWDGAGYTGASTKIVSYPSTGPGPNVFIKDSTGASTLIISCPTVTIITPLSTSNISIGRDVAHATVNTIKLNQNTPMAVAWNAITTDDYSCAPSIVNDPNNANWNTNWNSISLGGTDNGNGTKTWSGNTGTNLNTGTVGLGAYGFTITCTSSAEPTPNPTQSSTATLNIVKTFINEI